MRYHNRPDPRYNIILKEVSRLKYFLNQLEVWQRSDSIMEEYIRVEVVPEILRHYNNCIKDYKLTKYNIQPLTSMVNNWSSSLYSLDLSAMVKKDDGFLDQHYSLFVKCMMDNCEIHSYESSKKKFSNEIYIYNMVQPIFKQLLCQNHVKLFLEAPYAMMKDIKLKQYTEPMDAIVILENLSKQGYKLAPGQFLDMEHCVLALEQLGRWHALSLLVKELNPEQFYDKIVTNIEQCNWSEENAVNIRLCSNSFTERFLENVQFVEHSKTFSAAKIIEEKRQDILPYMTEIIQRSKQSKLSVLCHGDYCRNNILFEYNEAGEPMSAIPIDYQNVHYGSPALDISYFIYMNAKHEVRDNLFMASMQKYHSSLVTTMREILVKETKKSLEEISAILPSLDSILEDYKQYGIYGMIHAICFAPVLMGSADEINELILSMNGLGSRKFHECAMNIGGEVATSTVVDIFDTAVKLNQINIE